MKNENIDYYKKLIKELIETNNSIDEVPIDDKYYGQIYAIINTVSLKIYVGKTIHRKVIGGRYKNKLRNHFYDNFKYLDDEMNFYITLDNRLGE